MANGVYGTFQESAVGRERPGKSLTIDFVRYHFTFNHYLTGIYIYIYIFIYIYKFSDANIFKPTNVPGEK